MPDFAHKTTHSERLRRSIAGRMSGSLAYTALCVVTLIFALCLEKMPEQALARVHALFG